MSTAGVALAVAALALKAANGLSRNFVRTAPQEQPPEKLIDSVSLFRSADDANIPELTRQD